MTWAPCPEGCGGFWCDEHEQHASDCPCPPAEEWSTDPYAPKKNRSRPGRGGKPGTRGPSGVSWGGTTQPSSGPLTVAEGEA
jgi:hypothetical protein